MAALGEAVVAVATRGVLRHAHETLRNRDLIIGEAGQREGVLVDPLRARAVALVERALKIAPVPGIFAAQSQRDGRFIVEQKPHRLI